MAERLDHVLRAKLPWRDDEMTECGRPTKEFTSVISLDELKERVEKWGKQRTSFTVCMTCWNAAGNNAQWNTNPIRVIGREAERCGYGYVISRDSSPDAQRFAAELRAIAAVVAAHRQEFDDYITGLAAVTPLKKRKSGRDA